MTTTDTDALTEKIEAALWGVTQVYDAPHGHGTEVGVHAPVHKVVAAVLPIVAEEVRKAEAEAWDEGGAHVEGRGGHYDPDDNPYRESGDSDEH